MHIDARITICGGVPIGLAVFAVGVACGCLPVIETGAALAGTAVAIALVLEATLAEPA